MSSSQSARLYGLLAEFATADDLLDAVRRARASGFAVEAYTPFAVDGMPEAIGFPRNRVPLVTLLGGILGGAGAYFLQWYSAVVDYPLNVGGRPLHSWPSFIPVTFELTILGAALAAVFGMLIMNGLPQLRHPLFEVPDFDLASRNRFFLCIRACGAFDQEKAESMLRDLPAIRQCEVAA
ncbi:MAG TPA: DUF3341 domain-containing protein [Oxalicibacterium sp.]|jgi:hypothetical protein|nr:DUF3341 domain-containing protein [Oxalicibacterium sp.]